jgi:hypothetical protein
VIKLCVTIAVAVTNKISLKFPLSKQSRCVGKLNLSCILIALNYALWNAGAAQQLCFMDPYFKSWKSVDSNSTLRLHDRTMGFSFIHGANDANVANELIDRIHKMCDRPWLLTKGECLTGSDTYVQREGCL